MTRKRRPRGIWAGKSKGKPIKPGYCAGSGSKSTVLVGSFDVCNYCNKDVLVKTGGVLRVHKK